MAPSLDELLTKVRTDDAARQEYLDLLETLGPNSEVASTYRKKLATALF
jgi:thioredoxin-like negative regulator of GroEL